MTTMINDLLQLQWVQDNGQMIAVVIICAVPALALIGAATLVRSLYLYLDSYLKR